jgi:hypothetical protein
MISSELQQVVEAARAALNQEPEWSMMNSVPEGILRLSHTEAPAEYLDFLTLANEGIFGRVIIYSVKAVGKMQDYVDWTEDARTRLDRESWFCFGRVNRAYEDPLFISRLDGSVWGSVRLLSVDVSGQEARTGLQVAAC